MEEVVRGLAAGAVSLVNAVVRLNESGRARAIGVSNFAPAHLVDLIVNNEVVPAVNQIETHPFRQNAAFQDMLSSEGVQLESWGPFAEGKSGLFTNPLLTEIGRAHGKTVAQVVLRWLIQRDVVVIPKSVDPKRMAENIDIFDFSLTEDEMAEIVSLDTGDSQFFDHADPDMVRMLGSIRHG